MATEEDVYSTVFSVLKHPVRRRILRMLSAKPQTYTEILRALNVETGYLNYHLENMRDLVTKDEEGRYSLSVFGEAAVNLITRVEEPVKREQKTRVLGFRLTTTRLLILALIALLAANAYLLLVYQGLYRDRTNALGEVMIQTKGLLSEANNILNHTVRDGQIDFEVWDVMFRDLALQLRLYTTISALDLDHRQQWTQIRTAVDEVSVLFNQINQKYAKTNGRFLNLTDPQTSSLKNLLEALTFIEAKAFPQRIVMGANPEIRIGDEDMTGAVQVAVDIQSKVLDIRSEFVL